MKQIILKEYFANQIADNVCGSGIMNEQICQIR